ncbi:unnamed protein product [Paramecium sonneborni]|uniref:Uncharacterized protein n=1 Tax=Paramecium sonneborni TaxID=65129 RepID=A0A8S1QXW8_9CILI|nr:unnamed protein product [Paramecium sonneborni]
MNNKLFLSLLRQFNRTKFRNEKSIIADLSLNVHGDTQLNQIVKKNIALIRSYKSLLTILDYNQFQAEQNNVIKRLQSEFDDRAIYGFNCSNELFIKFLGKVLEKNCWNNEFDEWLLIYLKNNTIKMSQSFAQQLKKALQNYNKSENFEQILDDHIQYIEKLKQLI